MIPAHIAALANLFHGLPYVVLPKGAILYRGCWEASASIVRGSWYTPSHDDAAQYVAMHADVCRKRGLLPLLIEATTKRDLSFLELAPSHIVAFEAAYGRPWNHREIEQDVPEAFRVNKHSEHAGFVRPSTLEYFLCEPRDHLAVVNITSGQSALNITSKAKGYAV